MEASPSTIPLANVAKFIIYVAAVLTVVMVLFPPFVSLSGTEYAFLFSGPEWSRQMGGLAEGLGLRARLHWVLLLVQIAALWAIALGARQYLARSPTPMNVSLLMLGILVYFMS